MECKFDSQIDALEKYCELIDTLWNVNLCILETLLTSYKELIDTLWNVNKISIVLPFGIPPN